MSRYSDHVKHHSVQTERIFEWALSRYRGRYPRVLLVVLLRAQHLVLIVSLAVLALYLPMSWTDFAVLALASAVAQEI